MFALYRFILPHVIMRVCAGRETALRDLQAFALAAGLNGAMIGGYLTIAGRPPERISRWLWIWEELFDIRQ